MSIFFDQIFVFHIIHIKEMYGIQEVSKGHNPQVFVSSLHAVPTKGFDRSVTGTTSHIGTASGDKRRRVNYNVQQIQAEQFNLPAKHKYSNGMEGDDEEETVAFDLSPLEMKKATKRFEELNRENYNETGNKIELPKMISGHTINRDSKPGAVVKRLLVSKKTWSNFSDEIPKSQMKLIHNSGSLVVVPNSTQIKKLCTICGGLSYSSCIKCGSRVCCVKCQKIHDETRCTQY